VTDNVILAMTASRLGPLFGSARLRAAPLRARARQLLAYCGYAGDPGSQRRRWPMSIAGWPRSRGHWRWTPSGAAAR
jgi:hypothetical protein